MWTELGRIYAEINNKLSAEIGKIYSRDADYTTEAQKILSMVNNITTRLKKPVVIILAEFRLKCTLSILRLNLSRTI